MNSTTYEDAAQVLHAAENVIILAGSGLSSELGIRTYWSGLDPRYGGKISEFGYTDLEHATESFWVQDPEAMLSYHKARLERIIQLNDEAPENPYPSLARFVDGKNYFVMTTNVDGLFIRNGFDASRVYEAHGSILKAQCLAEPTLHGVFPARNPENGHSKCPECGSSARPNTLFFNDENFNTIRVEAQFERFSEFRHAVNPLKTVALEIGAGATVPTIRNTSVLLNRKESVPLVRVNPHEETGVDGIAGLIKPSTAPVYEIHENAYEALQKLL